MKRKLFGLAIASLLVLAAGQIIANDQCVMCHQDQKENAVAAHSNCASCHGAGADAHLADMSVAPEPVSNDTCTTCHQASEEFSAIPAHQMEMECSSCHTIHEK